MALELGPISPAARDGEGSRPGIIRRIAGGARWLGGGPADWLDRREIRRGGAAIGGFARALRIGGTGRGAFRTFADGTFDLEGTAAALGITVDELRARLAWRRRETARVAWGMWALAAAFLAAWLWQAFGLGMTAARVVSLLSFLPFILLCVVLGAAQALTNFQIRAGRAAGWREWLATEGRFWPG